MKGNAVGFVNIGMVNCGHSRCLVEGGAISKDRIVEFQCVYF